jgi:hypothetical protein
MIRPPRPPQAGEFSLDKGRGFEYVAMVPISLWFGVEKGRLTPPTVSHGPAGPWKSSLSGFGFAARSYPWKRCS